MGTFEVAANNSGRLRRAWPEAVFWSCRTATELSVLFAQEAGMEDYHEELIEAAREAERAVEEKFDDRTLALTSPFRAPSYALAHRRAQDAARITSRGLLPTAWCSGVIRAPRHFELSRWSPRYPRSWLNRGVWMEMPYALSYTAHQLVDEFSAVWHVVNAEYYYFLAAGWVHTLLTDKVFAWLDAKALKRMSKLDLHRMASGPGGQAMLDTFHKMHKATQVFPWTIVVRDVIRRDTQTRAARQVHVHLDSMAEYGFMLNHPCRGFACLPVGGGGSDDDGDTPVAAAQGNAGFLRQGTRAAAGPSRRAPSISRRSLSPVRETRVTAASGGHARPTQENIWTSPEAFQAAVALFGDGPSRRMDGQHVPRGVGAAALASAWNRQTEALRLAVRDAHGYVLEYATAVLARAMSGPADSAAAFDLFTQEVERLRQVPAVPPSPVRFDAGDILGRRCDNTPSLPHPVGGNASRAVSPGSPVGEYPPRKETPKSTHARRRPGEDTPSDKHELCDRKFTCPRRGPRGNTHASPSYPVRSPQTLRKPPLRHPQGTLRKPSLRHPQRNLRKPSPQGTWGQAQRRAVELRTPP